MSTLIQTLTYVLQKRSWASEKVELQVEQDMKSQPISGSHVLTPYVCFCRILGVFLSL